MNPSDIKLESEANRGAQISASEGIKSLFKVLGSSAQWLVGGMPGKPIVYESESYRKEKALKPKLDMMVSAISQMEGLHPSHRSQRNNNPGNLKFADQPGAEEDKDGFAIFRTMNDGKNALAAQIRAAIDGKSDVYHPNMTLLEFFKKYAPSKDKNNPKAYAAFVAQKMATTSEDKSLKDIFYGN